ncbi:TPA: glycosyltransferase, partial [Pasteurella multocida]|nr:glycosyltransferase [Pasteurella multocida]
MLKVTLAIATYNRITYIEKMINSLKSSVDISKINIRIYDDHSEILTKQDLEKLFPYAKEIIVRDKNLGADRNSRKIYDDFLQTNDDILINADSDLIYRPGWLEIIETLLPQTDGVLSLYNSNKHQFIEQITPSYGAKKTLGSAGTVLTREIVKKIVDNIPIDSDMFDWQWSTLLTNKNIKLICIKESYIQHIGILGQNNKGFINDFDYGLNFIPENEINQKIMSDFIDELFLENRKFIERKEKEIGCSLTKLKRLDYKVGHFILAIPREI